MVTGRTMLPAVPTGSAVHLWLAQTTPSSRWPVTADLTGLDRQVVAADRFVADRDRVRHLAAHWFLRQVLAGHTGIPGRDLTIRRTCRGRPTLDGPALTRIGYRPAGVGARLDFNLSHTGDTVMVGVVAGRRIGVDIEHLHRVGAAVDDLAAGDTPGERSWIAGLAPAERPRGGLRLWTLKEAYAKARGLGLALPFETFSFGFDPCGRLLAWYPPPDDPAGCWWFLELEPIPGLLLAVAVTGRAGPPGPVHLYYGCPGSEARPVPVVVTSHWIGGGIPTGRAGRRPIPTGWPCAVRSTTVARPTGLAPGSLRKEGLTCP